MEWREGCSPSSSGARRSVGCVAEVLPENADMLAVLREHGPCREHRQDGVVELELPVDPGRDHPLG